MTWDYWKLKERRDGRYVFEHSPGLGGAQLTATHPYLDPTNPDPRKKSDMLMVFNLGDERARAVAGGEYVLAVEQLYDLQEWCVPAHCGTASSPG